MLPEPVIMILLFYVVVVKLAAHVHLSIVIDMLQQCPYLLKFITTNIGFKLTGLVGMSANIRCCTTNRTRCFM